VFFVLDGSGSITLSYFEKMKSFLIRLIEQLDVGSQGTHVGLLQFSHSLKTKIEFSLGEHNTFEKIKEAISKMPYQEGGTDTGNALEVVNTEVSVLITWVWKIQRQHRVVCKERLVLLRGKQNLVECWVWWIIQVSIYTHNS
jgi:hypothetical protein